MNNLHTNGQQSFSGAHSELPSLDLDMVKTSVEALANDDSISSKIEPENHTGYLIYKNATSGVLDVAELCGFCVSETRVKCLVNYILNSYPSAVVRERQENKIRLEVSSEGLKISSLFSLIEENKEAMKVADYGISQTSLEQVFNMHAEEAEKAKHID